MVQITKFLKKLGILIVPTTCALILSDQFGFHCLKDRIFLEGIVEHQFFRNQQSKSKLQNVIGLISARNPSQVVHLCGKISCTPEKLFTSFLEAN